MKFPRLPRIPKLPKFPIPKRAGKASPPPAKAATKANTGHVHRSSKSYVIEVAIEGGTHLYYRFGAGAEFERLMDVQPGLPLVSGLYPFASRREEESAAEDLRFSLTKKMSARAAASHAQRELSVLHKLQAIVVGGAAYVTPARRIKIASDPVIPLAAAIEYLMRSSGKPFPTIAGVMLGQDELLLLLAFTSTGRVFMQTTVSPENGNELATSLASIMQIPMDDGTPVFTQDELLTALAHCPAFPTGGVLAGLPVNTAAMSLFALSALAVAGATGTYVYAGKRISAAQDALVVHKKRATDASVQIVERIASNRAGFGRLLTADVERGIANAQGLWIPGATIESEIAHNSDTHTVTLPIFKNSGAVPPPEARVLEMVTKSSLPKGCTHNTTTLVGELNEIQAKFSCVGVGSGLDDFGG